MIRGSRIILEKKHSIQQIKDLKFLRKYLGEPKLSHCISTANFMNENALIFKIDEEKAYIAGLLHDLAKDLDDNEVIKLSKEFKKKDIITVNYFDFKLAFPILLHGIAACELIVSDLKLMDTEILNAICSHTTSGADISKLAIFTFISDFCEPEREFEHSGIIYNMLINERNFYKAFFKTCYFKIERLVNKHQYICPESIDGYNYALNLWQNEI